MTKNDIDNYFTKNYQMLLKYASGFVAGFKRKYQPEEIVTEAYLNCVKCVEQDKITSINHIEQFAKSTIYCKIAQGASSMNFKRIVDKMMSDYDIIDIVYSTKNQNGDASQIMDVQVSTQLFDMEQELKVLFKEFKVTLNLVDKRLFEIVYEKNISTGKELAEHLKIPLTSAHWSLRNLNQQLRLYIETKYKN